MKTSKNTLPLLLLTVFSFLQCSSARNIQKNPPFEIGTAYYQNWSSGIKGADSGTNIYISIISNPNNLMLDSVYFKGQQVKLELENDTLFIGSLKRISNKKPDIIMSNDPYAEYGNQVPLLHKKNPFELKENECIISYNFKNKTAYFKINNVHKKESVQYP